MNINYIFNLTTEEYISYSSLFLTNEKFVALGLCFYKAGWEIHHNYINQDDLISDKNIYNETSLGYFVNISNRNKKYSGVKNCVDVTSSTISAYPFFYADNFVKVKKEITEEAMNINVSLCQEDAIEEKLEALWFANKDNPCYSKYFEIHETEKMQHICKMKNRP